MNSITDDTQETHVSNGNGDSAHGGLRARLERYERSAAGGIQSRVDDLIGTPDANPEPAAAKEIGEPISPELVLVDPELAARARALLADPTPSTAPVRVEPPPEPELEIDPNANRVVLGGAPALAEAVPLPHHGRRSRKRGGGLYAFALVVLLAEVAGVTYGGLFDPFSLRSGNDTVAPIADERPPANPPAKEPPPSATQPVPTKPPAPTTFPRAFVWAPVPGAGSYLVQFYRADKEIFRARPAEARVVVPAQWSYKGHVYRLEPGRYRWSVRPRLGAASRRHYGQAVVESQLVVQRR